jgi:polar amino acid transport system substrate-binding protein
MRTTRWLMTAILGLLLTACASVSSAPTTEARQALAPGGNLRVALQLGNPLNVVRDSASGEMKGVGFELGKELAWRLGVSFEPVLYPSIGALLEGGKSGAWDVAFIGFSRQRAKEWEFSALHLNVEFGYLVPGGSSLSTMADVDRPGIRVAVQEKSGPDVMGGLKPLLFDMSNQLPGSRVLDGRPGIDPHAMAMPRGRDRSGVVYARQFIEDAKSEGLVNAAIERAGLRGVTVAPLK